MNYTSIIVNTSNASAGSLVGFNIPSVLGFVEQDKIYTLQFKCRALGNSYILDNIYVGNQKLNSVDIRTFDTVLVEDTEFKLCHVTFTSNSKALNPSIKICKAMSSTDIKNADIFEITDISLAFGRLAKYDVNVGDFLLLRKEVNTKLQQLSDRIILSSNSEVVEELTGRISKALGQIQVNSGSIDLKVEQTDINNSINNIQIGGRNLLKNTVNTYKNISVTRWTGHVENWKIRHCSEYGLVAEESVTFGMDVKCLNKKKLNVRIDCYTTATSDDKQSFYGNVISGEGRSTCTFKIPKGKEYIVFYIANGDTVNDTTTTTEQYKSEKLEKGNKATDWTPAQEDVDASVKDAKDTANTAQSNATNAQNSANTANNKLSDIANDNKLTATEKQSAKKEWDVIAIEKPKIESEAVAFGINKDNYVSKYNALNTYIAPLLSNLTTTSDIVGNTFRTTFRDYYDARQTLLNAISSKSKQLADNAQAQANTNKGIISGLQTEVSTVKNNVSQLSVNLKGITQRVESTESTTTTLTTKVNKAQTDATKGINDAKTASDKVDNIQIGSRNFILNSALKDNTNNFHLNGGVTRVTDKKTPNGNNCFYINVMGLTDDAWRSANQKRSNVLIIGKKYTASCSVFISSNHDIDRNAAFEIICWDASNKRTGTFAQIIPISILDKWQKINVTFMVPENTTSFTIQSHVVRNGKLYIGDYSIVDGDKGVWTPAIEDTQNQINENKKSITQTNSKVSSIETNLSSITSRVSATESTTINLEKLTEKKAINNFSRSGTLERWNGDKFTLKDGSIYNKFIDIETSGNTTLSSDFFDLDPNKTYKFSGLFQHHFQSGNNGIMYFGIRTFDKNKNALPLVNQNAVSSIYQYFVSTNISIPDWKCYDGYLYSSDTNLDSNTPKGNSKDCFKMDKRVRYCEILVLNFRGTDYGNGKVGNVYFANPTISEVDNVISETASRLNSAEQKITSDAIISTVTKSQTYKNDLTGKVSTNQIISSINQTAEAIKIQAQKIDMTGDLDLQGQFKCYKSNSDKKGAYLYAQGAQLNGYKYNYSSTPTFACGLWNGQNGQSNTPIGYVSVAQNNALNADDAGCLWMSPNTATERYGCTLTYTRKRDSDGKYVESGVDFSMGGKVYYKSFIDTKQAIGYTSHEFDGGISCYTLNATEVYCRDIRSRAIYPEQNGYYQLGKASARFTDAFMDSISTTNLSLNIGTIKSTGAWEQYGPLAINSKDGYVFPANTGGALSLGTNGNRFHAIYLVSSPSVSSDRRLKSDIRYLGENNTEVIENRVVPNMHINENDMYNFVKDDLKIASYRYNCDIDKGICQTNYNFIAQDIINTKVGSEIVQLSDRSDLESELSYNQNNYISVLAGALQKAISKIEHLENEIKQLKEAF